VDVPEEYSGKVVEMASQRKGEMQIMERKGDRIHLEFIIPSRGIIGMRTNMLTATAGEAVMNHRFVEYQPYKGAIDIRNNGSLVALETGTAFAYSISKLADRGSFFIDPQQEIYEGQVIGENNRADDLTINVTKPKKLTNMRASGTDEKMRLITPIRFSLEEALEYIKDDELVEVTPLSIRMRKINLKEHDRKRIAKNS
jgi:GTP-binding protein